jgi:hypothetical protein
MVKKAKVTVKRKPTVAERNAVFDSIKANLKNLEDLLSTKSILKIADDAIAAYEKAKK